MIMFTRRAVLIGIAIIHSLKTRWLYKAQHAKIQWHTILTWSKKEKEKKTYNLNPTEIRTRPMRMAENITKAQLSHRTKNPKSK